MRVPYWLRGPTLEKLVVMRDQFSRSRVDLINGLEKTPPHYQRAYTLAPNFQSHPVQYRVSERPHVYDRETGITSQIDEDQPVRPMMPPEAHLGLWGGEGILKGFTKRSKNHVRTPRWWMPHLRETAFYSEILDKHYLIIVTHTTLERIVAAFGFDNYILQTPEVDLHSRLGMRLRREMLVTLAKKSLYPHDPDRRDEILEKYKRFIIPESDSMKPTADRFLDEIFQNNPDHEMAAVCAGEKGPLTAAARQGLSLRNDAALTEEWFFAWSDAVESSLRLDTAGYYVHEWWDTGVIGKDPAWQRPLIVLQKVTDILLPGGHGVFPALLIMGHPGASPETLDDMQSIMGRMLQQHFRPVKRAQDDTAFLLFNGVSFAWGVARPGQPPERRDQHADARESSAEPALQRLAQHIIAL
ncbi:uncharacterized protein LOC129595408 [Paramacrobiotus metropolitanus]|uniref:uncharacterized protein LOC129595408 n=1 Tax=Paramacrobiotus metropolitanus TaxID=2943436 RepID=UPI00244602BA|nr:uncharacterized protein LOC129595408 [Paramacrobiotus metropolitanus]